MAEKKKCWTVTRSDCRMNFADIKKDPYDGGSLATINELEYLEKAIEFFVAWYIVLENGCVQIFDAVSGTEHGFFML